VIESRSKRPGARKKPLAPKRRPQRSAIDGVAEREEAAAEAPQRGRIDISFFFLIIVLQTIGLIMLFSASYVTALHENGNSLYYVIRQSLFVIVGLIAMVVASYIDYHFWRKLKWLIYLGGIALMALALIYDSPNSSGARRWVYLPTQSHALISFQPSEIMKFAVAILCAHLIAANYKQMNKLKFGLYPFAIVLIPIAGLMVLQRHMSGLILMLLIIFTMMFVGGSKIRWFVVLGGAVVGLAVLFLMYKGFDYIQIRLSNWLDPLSGDLRGSKWQTAQSLYAIGSGGLMGVGLGNSTQKFLYLSEPQNDFIFAIVCEELGFVGALVIILLFVLLIYSGVSIAMRAPDKFGCMLVIGLVAQIGWQALLNIAVVTNSIPNTGISLPFFSAGGTALTMQLAQMGVILNVSRYCHRD
jgi:cell division protein FtsW